MSEAQQLTAALNSAAVSLSPLPASSSSSSSSSGLPVLHTVHSPSSSSISWSSLSSLLTSSSNSRHSSVGRYSYGTSGYRGLAHTLNAPAARSAVIAVLRAREHHQQQRYKDRTTTDAVGICVTASHNDAPDNGFKVIDANGCMLSSEWEPISDIIVNEDEATVIQRIQTIAQERGIKLDQEAEKITPILFVGRDTRDSSRHLTDIIIQTALAAGARVHDYQLTTTPQLHWLVHSYNSRGVDRLSSWYDNIASSFLTAWHTSSQLTSSSSSSSVSSSSSSSSSSVSSSLFVDCANGVGAVGFGPLLPLLSSVLPISLRNRGSADGVLNHECGAEHVQKTRKSPANFNPDSDTDNNDKVRLAALDGDADRLVYFYYRFNENTKKNELRLLDGDKLIALFTNLISDLLKSGGFDSSSLSVGVVQTAYANGSSTRFLHSLSMPVVCTPTGVKHLHHRAEELDIGIYFEANGHGTVLFSEKAVNKFKQAIEENENNKAATVLYNITKFVNQTTGCAIADLLLVELALHHLSWSVPRWDSVYEDLPSRMTKVVVRDRTAVVTTDAERRVSAPAGLQDEIDAIIANSPLRKEETASARRTFVRPSGTEDVVRVYAEAADMDQVNEIIALVEAAVKKFC